MNVLLGKKIKLLRQMHNFTEEQMASFLGISLLKYVRIEEGNETLTLDILSRIADVLGITVGDITEILNNEVLYNNNENTGKMFNMINLFYANKHLYNKITTK